MVAHEFHDVANGQFFVRFDPEGEGLAAGDAAGIVAGQLEGGGRAAEAGPDPRLAKALGAEIERGIGVGKAEFLVRAGEVALFPGKRDDIPAEEAVLRIVEGELADARLVGVAADVAVGDAARHPEGAGLALTLADHLQDPDLAGIGDGEGLAAAAVAVFFDQAGHHPDRFTGVSGPLQGEIHQAAVIKPALGIVQFRASAEGGLADGELVFIHVAHNGVSLGHLFDLAEVAAAVPVIDIDKGSLNMPGGGKVDQFAVEGVRIG